MNAPRLGDMFGAASERKIDLFFAVGLLLTAVWILTGCTLLPASYSSQAAVLASPISGVPPEVQITPDSAELTSPSASPTTSPSDTIAATEIPTSTVNYSAMPLAGHSIAIRNPFNTEVHVFIDKEYVLTVTPRSSGSLNGIQSGVHTFHYCQAVDQLECADPQSIDIQSSGELHIPAFTDSMTAEVEASETPQTEASLSPTPDATPTLLPTPRVMRGTFYTLKINNPNPWWVHAYIDGELLLSIKKMKYRTYRSMQPGTYSVTYCRYKKMRQCFRTVEFEVTGDTELWAFP